MKKFVAVIGDRNSGKSTVIKSLTGCGSGTFRGRVEDKLTDAWIHVVCSSPQERALSFEELTQTLTECMSDPRCRGIVMAIQPTHPHTRLSLENIFQAVQKTNAFTIHAYLLEHGYAQTSRPQDFDATTQRLRPYRVKPVALDGRRFSFLNAESINEHTKIVK